MTPAEAYQKYVAIKLHFSQTSYDYFRFNGRVKNLSSSSMDARGDGLHFERLARHHDPIGLLVSHLVENPDAWIGDILNDETPLHKRKKFIGALSRNYQNDLAELGWSLDNVIRLDKHRTIPKLFDLYLGGYIALETASIIVDMAGDELVTHWSVAGEPFFINALSHRLSKYQPFLVQFSNGDYDRNKYIDLTLNYFRRGLERGRTAIRSVS